MPRWTFFLGGRDLEMVEIARLLAGREDVAVFDRSPEWGVGASVYLEELTAALAGPDRLVLVELTDDLPPDFPRGRLTWIDHHGPQAGNVPSSIEQVFELLAFPKEQWTRNLELVAANDRGHIEALVQAGASSDEIRAIRQEDRRAQGITPQQEEQGRSACRSRVQAYDGRLTVVKLPHTRSATVTDVLDSRLGGPGYENLLVVSPNETQFYGLGRIVERLAAEFPGSWSGGEMPRRGFWGIQKEIAEEELIRLIGDLLHLPASEVPVRIFHHILLWPMLLHGPSSDPKTDKEPIEPWIKEIKDSGWQEPSGCSTEVSDAYSYAEFVYFHPFVRDFLFGDGRTKAESRALRRFTRNGPRSVRVTVTAPREDRESAELTLNVNRVELFLIRPRVAILLVEVSMPETSSWSLEQVLIFQSRFHQIYPPYFKDRFRQGVRDGDEHGDCLYEVEWVDMKKTPEVYTTKAGREEFEEFTRKASEPPVYDHWMAFLGDQIQPLGSKQSEDKPAQLYVQQLLDNRMPGMSFIGVDDPREIHPDDLDRLPSFDPPGLDYDPKFRESRRDRFRYTRFSHWRTTYYGDGTSMALVTEAGDFARQHLLNHFQRHYTHIALIAQYQHAALLHFADEMADTVKELAGLSDEEELAAENWSRRIRRLQSRFLKFRTRSYFTEVSNQIQGKDLFRFWLDHLGTEALFERVARTNAEVFAALQNHEVMTLARIQTRSSRRQARLARVATWGLMISIFMGVCSITATLFGLRDLPGCLWLYYIAAASVLAAILIGLFNWLVTGDPRRNPVRRRKRQGSTSKPAVPSNTCKPPDNPPSKSKNEERK